MAFKGCMSVEVGLPDGLGGEVLLVSSISMPEWTHLVAHRELAIFWYFLTGRKRKKPVNIEYLQALIKFENRFGRDDKIRTCDPLHPMQVRYRAALRPELSLTGQQM